MKQIISVFLFLLLNNFCFNQDYVSIVPINKGKTSSLYVGAISSKEVIKDIDGNEYKLVKLGKQVWFKENLKTTKYSNGSEIKYVTDSMEWVTNVSGAYRNYDNDKEAYKDRGKLYNWYTVSSKMICPQGWHVPSDADWLELIKFLEGFELAGNRLKDVDCKLWGRINPKSGFESGFEAVPSGYCSAFGWFSNVNDCTYWWSSTEASDKYAWLYYISRKNSIVKRENYNKRSGFSVRCLKD